MILCKSCGYEGVYEGRFCPHCKSEFSLSAEEISRMEGELRVALAEGAHETAVELTHILADAGLPSAAATYGRMLFEGDGVAENQTAALEYLSLSALAGDAKGAYAYGKALQKRGKDESGFFLLYSALLGYAEAYEAAAAALAAEGKEEAAVAYLSLSALGGSRSAALALARRYERGKGVVANSAYAKWYLSQSAPLSPYAWPMAFRLRHTVPMEPPMPTVPHLSALITHMLRLAEQAGYKNIEMSLCQMLATRGDAEAQCRLGKQYVQGYFGKPEPTKGKDVLAHYGRKGNAAAYLLLGDLYRTGEGLPASRVEAAACYNAAKALGSAEACVRLGDLYAEGQKPNIPYAHQLYKEALALGSREGADKARRIEDQREELYESGKQLLITRPENAFHNFARAASMGYTPAAVALGFCYEEGLGVKMDRRRAFLWYERASKEKENMAQYRLARCYLHGIGVNRDYKMARVLLRRASIAGIEEARIDLLNMLDRRKVKLVRSVYSMGMRLLYKGKYAAARSAMERASELGVAKATYTLGCFYEFGIGVKMDRDLAYATYRAAQEQGFYDVRAVYKSVLLKMIHGKQKSTV